MTGCNDEQSDNWRRGDAVGLDKPGAKRLLRLTQHGLGPPSDVVHREIRPKLFGFLGGNVILLLDRLGGVAGPRSNGKCQLVGLFRPKVEAVPKLWLDLSRFLTIVEDLELDPYNRASLLECHCPDGTQS